jgi:hypothetical protein
MNYEGPGDSILRPMNGRDYGPLWADRYPLKLILHTTETATLPGYNNGSYAPHITIDTLARKVWQHVPLDRRCGALRGSIAVYNDTGVRTVMNEVCVQVEIIGYSDRNIVLTYGGNRRWVGDFGDADYEFIGRVVAYLRQVCAIGDGLHAMPAGEAWRYGINSRFRMPAPEPWESFAGMTAHGGVFGQRHWDTGVLNLWRIHDLRSTRSTSHPFTTIRRIGNLRGGILHMDAVKHSPCNTQADDIRALSRALLFQGDPEYWWAWLNPPDHPEWQRFWTAVYINSVTR